MLGVCACARSRFFCHELELPAEGTVVHMGADAVRKGALDRKLVEGKWTAISRDAASAAMEWQINMLA